MTETLDREELGGLVPNAKISICEFETQLFHSQIL